MSDTAPTQLLTAKEVADYFQVSVRTIRRWRRDGHLPTPLQIGGSLRWRECDLHAWLARGCGNSLTASTHLVLTPEG